MTAERTETALHPRVLDLDQPDERSFVVVCWRDPGGAAALHHSVAMHVEGALLAELSKPAAHWNVERATPRFVRLLALSEIAGDVERALRAFAMRRTLARGPVWRRALAHVRHEASVTGHPVPEEPASVWEADVLAPDGSRGALLQSIERFLVETTRDEKWGEHPGAPTERLSAALERAGIDPLEPTLQSLEAFEQRIVGTTPGTIRWIPPLTFQALCDFVAVVAHVMLGAPVEWAVCDEVDDAPAPPPLVRIGATHIPLGAHVLRWCVMPVQPDEVIPPLAHWLTDQLSAISSSARPA